jgi:hypothetical protein
LPGSCDGEALLRWGGHDVEVFAEAVAGAAVVEGAADVEVVGAGDDAEVSEGRSRSRAMASARVRSWAMTWARPR